MSEDFDLVAPTDPETWRGLPSTRVPSEPYYQDELVTIYHADSMTWLPPADVLIMDPPYGIGWRRGTNAARGSKAQAGIQNDDNTTARDTVLARLPIPAIVFGSFYAPFPAQLRQVLVWHKPPDAGVVGSTTGYRRDAEPIFLVGPWPMTPVARSSVLRSRAASIGNPSSPAGRTGHPHAKPGDLMAALIDAAPAGTVLDPFMGSGSTLVAAKSLGRRAVGIDIEERWCAEAARRCSQEVLGLVG